MESHKGKILIAAPSLRDPNFSRTLVFLCEHTKEGAFGLITNRSLSVSVRDAFSHASQPIPTDHMVHQGGPVQTASISILHNFLDLGGTAVNEWIAYGADRDIFESLFCDPKPESFEFRVFAGYAGWGAGQLEDELQAESWFVRSAVPELVLRANGLTSWRRALSELGGKYHLMSLMPSEPELN